jgi:hypothetical protein
MYAGELGHLWRDCYMPAIFMSRDTVCMHVSLSRHFLNPSVTAVSVPHLSFHFYALLPAQYLDRVSLFSVLCVLNT